MYKIGNNYYSIEGLDHLSVPENFAKFNIASNSNQMDSNYSYNIKTVDELLVPSWNISYKKDDIIVLNKDNKEARLLMLPTDRTPYACYVEEDSTTSTIYVLEAFSQHLQLDTLFNSLFALEKRAMEDGSFLLHSCYLKHNNKAILFTGPSGVGKSTQADLWVKYRQARIINGDRSLISEDDSGYNVHPWPVCGSSDICMMEEAKLACIVYLSQAEDNQASILSSKDAIKRLISETTINYWNREYVNKAYDFICSLACYVPVINLQCNISENAVITLENLLNERGII